MPTPIKILIVEDSPEDAELLLAELRRVGYAPNWRRVETEPDFLTEILSMPEIILCDYSMPQFSGLRAVELLRQSGFNIPFILVSGTVGEDVAVEAMKHGATDYLLKDRIVRLGIAIEQALEQKRLRHERQRTKAELLESKRFLRSTLDALTTHIAIINESGTILDVNAAWNTFAKENHFLGSQCGIAENYFIVCDSASGNLAAEARAVSDGIRAVIAGHIKKFKLEYPCHSPREQRWFVVRVTRFESEGPLRAVIAHENVTDRKLAELELAQTHKQLLQISRQAGMAEVATGVLHNVGNVLNSVNVAAACLTDSIKKSKAVSLTRVVGLMREHEKDLGDFLTNDEKGRQIPGYLGQLGEHLATEQSTALRELADLQKNIEHIKDIVTMQQGYAKMSGLTELLSATELIEDALKMNSTSLMRHDVTIVREFEAVPPIMVEKHKALQILVNLMRNATQAYDDSGRAEKKITLRVTQTPDHVRIAVVDNGAGITKENLTRIFAHGFTTKKDGHGFGLHSCALAAKEMQGSLTVHSDGPGTGATFTLELPSSPE